MAEIVTRQEFEALKKASAALREDYNKTKKELQKKNLLPSDRGSAYYQHLANRRSG